MKTIHELLEKIPVKDIPEEGLKLIFDEFREIEDVKVLSNIKGEATFEWVSGNILLRGNFKTDILLACDRCLEEFAYEIRDEFLYVIMDVNKKDLHGEDETNIIYFDGVNIQFIEVIHEQIILQIPHKILCTESCKGICKRCGTNLNFYSCNCELNEINSPFAVLKRLSF